MKKIFLIIFFSLISFTYAYSDESPFEPPNFWILSPDNCKLNIYYNEGNENTKLVLNCPDGEVTYEVNFQVLLGYANPQPAKGSTFVLNNRNLNYLTKPDVNLKIHFNYLGNNNLKVEVKTEDLNWNETLKINFEKELLCPIDLNCADYTISNSKISELVNYFEKNLKYAPYIQELVNKIVENKDKSYEMARAAAIFMKNWFITVVNLKSFFDGGIIFQKLVGGHCSVDECCIIKCFREDCRTYCWTKCHYLFTDP